MTNLSTDITNRLQKSSQSLADRVNSFTENPLFWESVAEFGIRAGTLTLATGEILHFSGVATKSAIGQFLGQFFYGLALISAGLVAKGYYHAAELTARNMSPAYKAEMAKAPAGEPEHDTA